MFFVYILKGKNEYHYIGLTRKLSKRIQQHQQGLSKVTSPFRPLMLVWYCVFTNKYTAARFEKYLKSGSGRAFSVRHLYTLADEVTL